MEDSGRALSFILKNKWQALDITTDCYLSQADGNKDDNLKRQGSFRKLLPLNTNGDSQLSMSVKMIDRPIMLQTNKEYAVYLQEYNVLSE